MGQRPVLSELPAFNPEGCLRAVIETPKGSPNKYDFNPEFAGFELAKTPPEGMTFPFDFGFIPSTQGGDGDPLDVLVLMDFPATPGCVVNARLIGCLQPSNRLRQRGSLRTREVRREQEKGPRRPQSS
jgi:inorganic pyrophosphatase